MNFTLTLNKKDISFLVRTFRVKGFFFLVNLLGTKKRSYLGDIVLDLKKETKTKNIKVVLEGLVDLGGRTMVLFSKSVLTAEPPDGEKYYTLDPHTHRFPFMITIPTSQECKVPSTLEVSSTMHITF